MTLKVNADRPLFQYISRYIFFAIMEIIGRILDELLCELKFVEIGQFMSEMTLKVNVDRSHFR